MTLDRILESYSSGDSIQVISEMLGLSEDNVIEELLKYKDESRTKNTFNDEFKKIVAERDINGASRSDIARELNINANTVKKACVKFGQAIKEKPSEESVYTRIDGEFTLDICPSCGSRKNNLVDEFTTFCMSCDSEHEYYEGEDGKGYVLRINFEYIE